jgi:hypothetical protein
MSWSYRDPSANDKDWVRWRVGDTDYTDQLQSDEEIIDVLSIEGNKYMAAAQTAEAISGQLSREADKTVGPLRIATSQRADGYAKLAKRIRSEIAGRVAPYAGGISVADMDAVEADTDRVPADFAVGMDDTPGTATAAEDERLGD